MKLLVYVVLVALLATSARSGCNDQPCGKGCSNGYGGYNPGYSNGGYNRGYKKCPIPTRYVRKPVYRPRPVYVPRPVPIPGPRPPPPPPPPPPRIMLPRQRIHHRTIIRNVPVFMRGRTIVGNSPTVSRSIVSPQVSTRVMATSVPVMTSSVPVSRTVGVYPGMSRTVGVYPGMSSVVSSPVSTVGMGVYPGASMVSPVSGLGLYPGAGVSTVGTMGLSGVGIPGMISGSGLTTSGLGALGGSLSPTTTNINIPAPAAAVPRYAVPHYPPYPRYRAARRTSSPRIMFLGGGGKGSKRKHGHGLFGGFGGHGSKGKHGHMMFG